MTRFVFEQFCLDTDRKELLRGGEPVHLTPRAFRLFEGLVRHRPKAMSKRELLDLVWAGAIVEESNLKTLVLEIRTALEERGGNPSTIRTVYGYGYAFAGTAGESDVPEELPPVLLVRWAGRELTLQEGSHLIGRGPDCAITIDQPSVSRVHARLRIARGGMAIEDLRSKNGTFVGASRLTEPHLLADGEEIRVGDLTLTFHAHASLRTETAAP